MLSVLLLAGLTVYLLDNVPPRSDNLPPGFKVSRVSGSTRYLTVESFVNITGFRNERATNILIGPSVSDVSFIGNYIYGHNAHVSQSDVNDLGLAGYFVIDIKLKKVYYNVDRDVIERIESGYFVPFSDEEVDMSYEDFGD